MNKNTKFENTNISVSVTHAKIENLYTNMKEMYENGSKQSFMTLNIQFIISQMIALTEKATDNFIQENPRLGQLLTSHAESFYEEYQKRGFYLIENSLGFLYCMMTLLFRNMVFSTAANDILQYLGALDPSKLFLSKEIALRNLLKDNNLDRREFLFLTEMFEPDEATKSFRPLSTSTPKHETPGFAGLEKKVHVKEDVATEFLDNLQSNIEKVVLKPSPFEGEFSEYYNVLLSQAPTAGYSRQYDERKINEIPFRYYIEVDKEHEKIGKKGSESSKPFEKDAKGKRKKVPMTQKFPTILEDSFSSPVSTYTTLPAHSFQTPTKGAFSSPLSSDTFATAKKSTFTTAKKSTFATPMKSTFTTPMKDTFATPMLNKFKAQQKTGIKKAPFKLQGDDFKTPEAKNRFNLSVDDTKTPTRETDKAAFDAVQQQIMGRVRLTPGKNSGGKCKTYAKNKDSYIIRLDPNRKIDKNINTEKEDMKRRQYRLPSHIKKRKVSPICKRGKSPTKQKESMEFPGMFPFANQSKHSSKYQTPMKSRGTCFKKPNVSRQCKGSFEGFPDPFDTPPTPKGKRIMKGSKWAK